MTGSIFPKIERRSRDEHVGTTHLRRESSRRAEDRKEGDEVTEAQNLSQRIQEQTVKSAQDFYGESVGQLKGRLENDRAELESLVEQLPESQEEARSQIQELVDSYEEIENTLDQVAQGQGVEDIVSDTVQQVQEAVGQVAQGAQETVDGAVEQAQDAVGGAVQQAQDTAGQ